MQTRIRKMLDFPGFGFSRAFADQQAIKTAQKLLRFLELANVSATARSVKYLFVNRAAMFPIR
jgi:GTP-binding protein EngB required for normal cell division